jgi:hypothetical protein
MLWYQWVAVLVTNIKYHIYVTNKLGKPTSVARYDIRLKHHRRPTCKGLSAIRPRGKELSTIKDQEGPGIAYKIMSRSTTGENWSDLCFLGSIVPLIFINYHSLRERSNVHKAKRCFRSVMLQRAMFDVNSISISWSKSRSSSTICRIAAYPGYKDDSE